MLIKRLIELQASKVTVLGAAGGIGQPLSLLMKLNPRVTELSLYDIRGGPGSLT
jgi:malate dehydrogenase